MCWSTRGRRSNHRAVMGKPQSYWVNSVHTYSDDYRRSKLNAVRCEMSCRIMMGLIDLWHSHCSRVTHCFPCVSGQPITLPTDRCTRRTITLCISAALAGSSSMERQAVFIVSASLLTIILHGRFPIKILAAITTCSLWVHKKRLEAQIKGKGCIFFCTFLEYALENEKRYMYVKDDDGLKMHF